MKSIKEYSELIEGLDCANRESGGILCRTIEDMFNCFSSYSSMAEELYLSLSKKGKKILLSVACMAAFELAWTWEEKGFSDWDKRKRASEDFAFKNRDYFYTCFHKAAGFEVGVRERAGRMLIDCLNPRTFEGNVYLLGFLSRWVNMHPTLQQAFFGGMVQGVFIPHISKKNEILKPPLDYTEICFPFI